MLTNSQRGLGFVSGCCRVGEVTRQRRAVVKDDVFIGRARDRRSTAGRYGYGDQESIPAGWRRDVPAVPSQGVALLHQERVACVGGGRGIIGGGGARTVEAVKQLVAAVVDFQEELVVPLTQIHGLQDIDVHRVLDLPAGVSWRKLDVGDQRVSRIRWIDLTVSLATKLLVHTDRPERRAAESGGFSTGDIDLGDAGLGGRS